MAKCSLRLDTRRALKDDTYPVKIAVGYGTNVYITTGVSVTPLQWDVAAGKVMERKDAKRLNDVLSSQLTRVTARVLRLREEGRFSGLSSGRLKKLLTASDMDDVPEEDSRLTFYEIARRCVSTKDKESTRRLYGYTIDKVRAYTGSDILYMEDIDRLWLHGFDTFIGGKINARAVHLRNVKAICNFALDEEYTTAYPFRKFKIRTEETRKKALTIGQVRAYATADITYRYDAMHRDVFMLMLYFRGINVSDLASLTWKDLKDGRVEYRRNKTGHLYSIRVEPEAREIIERWKGEEHLLSVFDRYSNPHDYARRMWEALKRIEGPDGRPIEPDCSSNWARHTWATLAAELDIPDPTISLGMGHVSAGNRTTAIYIKRDERKIDEANRQVIDYVWGYKDPPLQVNP